MSKKKASTEDLRDDDLILTDEWLLSEDLIFPDGVEGGPDYSVAQVAEFFFARSSHWMRWHEKKDALVYVDTNGKKEQLEPRRTSSNARKYDLALVEKIAHGLAQQDRIDASQLIYTLNLVRVQAKMHKVLPKTYPLSPVEMKGKGPDFEIREMTHFFFNRSPDWLTLMEKDVPVPSLIVNKTKRRTIFDLTPRVSRRGFQVRVYDLALVERIANALLEADRITQAQRDTAVELVNIKAGQYKLLDPQAEVG